jgi:Holliday junction DNA helicase RuvA
MIGQLRGVLLEKHAPTLVVEAGGIGYELQVPMTSFYQLPSIGKEVTLYTHLVVRDDAQLLYGFVRKQERSLFRSLIKINGVGPKLALTILSGIDADTFVRCVRDNDIASLVRLPGIGKKTAQRLLMEMRDSLKGWDVESSDISVAGNTAINDAISALIALGYKQQEAHSAVIRYKEKNLSSEQLIRLALQGK